MYIPNIYIHIHTYIYMYIYMCIRICIWRSLHNRFFLLRTHCNALQHIATLCITLQFTATHRTHYNSMHIWQVVIRSLHSDMNTSQRTATHCNTLQQWHATTQPLHAALNTLQRTVTYCNALQLTETHCNSLQRWQVITQSLHAATNTAPFKDFYKFAFRFSRYVSTVRVRAHTQKYTHTSLRVCVYCVCVHTSTTTYT